MGYIQNAKPGVGAVGEYQAAGRPWIKTVTVSSGGTPASGVRADAAVAETRVDFPAITRRLIIRNISDAAIYVHFASLATTHDGAVAAGNSAVKTTKNFVIVAANTGVLDLDIKCRFVYLSVPGAATKNVEVIAELTNIQEPYDLNIRSLSGVTT